MKHEQTEIWRGCCSLGKTLAQCWWVQMGTASISSTPRTIPKGALVNKHRHLFVHVFWGAVQNSQLMECVWAFINTWRENKIAAEFYAIIKKEWKYSISWELSETRGDCMEQNKVDPGKFYTCLASYVGHHENGRWTWWGEWMS